MSSKGSDQDRSAGVQNDSESSETCGFSASKGTGDETGEPSGEAKMIPVSPLEEMILKEAAARSKDTDARWFDARGQSGPSPSDFGDHKPIPADTICAAAVIVEEEEE